MTGGQARFILQQMLDGIDPTTGEILPENHLCHAPDVIRALHHAMLYMPPEEAPTEKIPASADSPMMNKNGRLNAGRPWTEDELDTLRQLHLANVSIEDICNLLMRRRRGVEKQLAMLGLTQTQPKNGAARAGQRWTADEDDELREMYEMKLSAEAMAQALQRSEYAIFCRMANKGLFGDLPGYPQGDGLGPWSAKETSTARQMNSDGCPPEEIAEMIGRPVDSVKGRLFYLGLRQASPLPALHQEDDTISF